MPAMRGLIPGKTIELENEPNMPEGREATVAVEPISGIAANNGVKSFAGELSDTISLADFLSLRKRLWTGTGPDRVQ